MREEKLGGLKARITGGTDREGGGDGPVVVLLHGFGAPGTDLVPLWRVLDVPPATRFVFPEAPLPLPEYGGGRAWWLLDLERMARLASGQTSDIDRSTEIPDGLAAARAQVSGLLDEIEIRLDGKTIVLGGFSQGAMVACDVALHRPRPVAGLVILSGTLVAASEWRPLAAGLRGVPVLQSHGQNDPLLSFSAAEHLRDLLRQGGATVEWLPFRGGHEIPEAALDRLAAFIRDRS